MKRRIFESGLSTPYQWPVNWEVLTSLIGYGCFLPFAPRDKTSVITSGSIVLKTDLKRMIPTSSDIVILGCSLDPLRRASVTLISVSTAGNDDNVFIQEILSSFELGKEAYQGGEPDQETSSCRRTQPRRRRRRRRRDPLKSMSGKRRRRRRKRKDSVTDYLNFFFFFFLFE